MALTTPLPTLVTLAIFCTVALVTTGVPLPPSPTVPTFGTPASTDQALPEIPTSSALLEAASDPGRLQHYKQMGLEETQVPKSQPFENVHPDAKAFPAVPTAAQNAMLVGAPGPTRGAAAGVHVMGNGQGEGGNGAQEAGPAMGRGMVAESGTGGGGGEGAMAVSRGAGLGAGGVDATANSGAVGIGARANGMAVGGGMNAPMGVVGA